MSILAAFDEWTDISAYCFKGFPNHILTRLKTYFLTKHNRRLGGKSDFPSVFLCSPQFSLSRPYTYHGALSIGAFFPFVYIFFVPPYFPGLEESGAARNQSAFCYCTHQRREALRDEGGKWLCRKVAKFTRTMKRIRIFFAFDIFLFCNISTWRHCAPLQFRCIKISNAICKVDTRLCYIKIFNIISKKNF